MKKITDYKKPNNLRALLGLTKASIISTLRSPTALFFNFFFPFIFIIIFGLLSQGEMVFDVGIRNESLKSGKLYEV